MRYLLSLVFIILLSFTTQAQHGWNLYYGVGFNMADARVRSGFTSMYPDVTGNTDVLFDMQLSKQVNKHWQVGVSLSTGKVQTWIQHKIVTYYNDGTHLRTNGFNQGEEIFAPNVSPTVFAHYQLNFGKAAYVYGGPALVVIHGRNSLGLKNMTKPLGGVNMGIAVPVSKYAKLQLSHGWRITNIKLKDQTTTVNPSLGTDTYVIRSLSDKTLSYFTFTIGTVVIL